MFSARTAVACGDVEWDLQAIEMEEEKSAAVRCYEIIAEGTSDKTRV